MINWKTIQDINASLMKKIGIFTKEDILGEKTFKKKTIFDADIQLKNAIDSIENGSLLFIDEDGNIRTLSKETFKKWIEDNSSYLTFEGTRLTYNGEEIFI